MIPELPSMPVVASYAWTGYYAESLPPNAWPAPGFNTEDGREHALIDVLVKQFDQWAEMDGGPERAQRVLAYLAARYRSTGVDRPLMGVDNRERQA